MSEFTDLIKKARIKEALDYLERNCTASGQQDELSLLVADFNRLEKQNRMGIISATEYGQGIRKITLNALELHRQCGEGTNEESTLSKSELLEDSLLLVEEEDIELLFDLLDKRGIKAAILSKLKKEFIAGVHKTDADYTARLKMALKRTLGNR